jgi:hypothetical protein
VLFVWFFTGATLQEIGERAGELKLNSCFGYENLTRERIRQFKNKGLQMLWEVMVKEQAFGSAVPDVNEFMAGINAVKSSENRSGSKQRTGKKPEDAETEIVAKADTAPAPVDEPKVAERGQNKRIGTRPRKSWVSEPVEKAIRDALWWRRCLDGAGRWSTETYKPYILPNLPPELQDEIRSTTPITRTIRKLRESDPELTPTAEQLALWEYVESLRARPHSERIVGEKRPDMLILAAGVYARDGRAEKLGLTPWEMALWDCFGAGGDELLRLRQREQAAYSAAGV